MTATSITAWTLLHFVWQGVAVAGVVAVLLRAVRRSQLRYTVAAAGFLLMTALPVSTAVRLAAGPTATAATLETPSPTRLVNDVTADPVLPATSPTGPALQSTPEDATPRTFDFGPAIAAADRAAPLLVVLWLSGVLLLSLRLLGGWLRVRQLTRVATSTLPRDLSQRLAEIARALGVRQPVRLLESARVQVPAVIGWLRPVILIPLSLTSGLPPRELELLLAHELAHVRRHDYLVNLLQTIVETVLFYHPAVWWLSRRIREEREQCCDDVAVVWCGDSRAYAEALVRLEGFRHAVPALAAAASGGNLLRRIRRLVQPSVGHTDVRTRWAALPLAFAALAGIVGGSPSGSAVAADLPDQRSGLEATLHSNGASQGRGARPDTVMRYAGDGSNPLELRLRWAHTAARQAGRSSYWIGYSIAADPSRGLVYMDRFVPATTTDGNTMFGSFRTKQASGLVLSGVSLDSLVGPRSTDEAIVMFGFRRTGSGPVLDRIHVGSGMLPVHFGGRTLIWLDRAADGESLELVRQLFGATRDRDLAHDLVSTAGMHLDGRVVLPVLRDWLATNESEDIRAEVAEELASVALPEAVALMARTARADRSRRVRSEAAEALGEVELAEAADTLARLVLGLDDVAVGREAVEALGERPEPAAFDALVRLVWDGRSPEFSREAVESMGESKDERRRVELERIVLTHRESGLRAEAAETLGAIDDPAFALRVLQAVLDQETASSVRQEAIETLGELDDKRAMEVLGALAERHRDSEVRREALAEFAEHGTRDRVLTLLRDMLGRTSSPEDGLAAIEALAHLEDERAVALLETTAMRHANSKVRQQSVEALGDAAPVPLALAAIARLARGGPDEYVQRAAIETFAGTAETNQAITLLASLLREGARAVQAAALEQLGDLDDGAGTAAIAEAARSHPDAAMRRKALEVLEESDDPKARTAVAKLAKP